MKLVRYFLVVAVLASVWALTPAQAQEERPLGRGPMGWGPGGYGMMGPTHWMRGGPGWGRFAGRGHMGPMRGREFIGRGGLGIPPIYLRLGLSDAQWDRYFEIRREEARTIAEAQVRSRHARFRLQQAVRSDDVSEEDLDKRVEEVAKAQHVLLRAHVKFRRAYRQILTPEQRKALQSFWRGRGPQRGMGPGGRRP